VDLDQLIATEQRLDEGLRRAREEAARLVREAREAAQRREAELEAELEAAARAFAAEAEAERARQEREIASEAAARVTRYDMVPPQLLEAAARAMVERLVEGWAG
jgi:vacuolar-type H+-ATPase subunit H